MPNIEHFVVLMLENRSFDHFFGFRPGVNGLKGNESNLLKPGSPESDVNPAFVVDNAAPYAVQVGQGPGHSVDQTNEQLFDTKTPTPAQKPANDGFVKAYSGELFADFVKNPTHAELAVVMESFAPVRLPSLNALADNFCLCDNWFSEVPGPTQPNRLYLHAATSAGFAHNVWSKQFDLVTIYENIQSKGLTWSTYEFDQNEVREFTRINQETNCFKKFEAFAGDVQGGTLPNYCFIAPRFNNATDGMANSQHAPEDVRYGDNLIADVYETPAAAKNPDGINSPAPGDKATYPLPQFAFDRLGLRVPAVIVSPWVGKGIVDSTLLQHTSILATAKEIFQLPKFLTKRDAAANSFTHLFSQPSARTDAPAQLPRAPLPQVTAAPSEVRHPLNHPLDHTQQEILLGVHHLTRTSDPNGPAADELPKTQGEASKYIRARYVKHFGPLAEAGAHLKGRKPPRNNTKPSSTKMTEKKKVRKKK